MSSLDERLPLDKVGKLRHLNGFMHHTQLVNHMPLLTSPRLQCIGIMSCDCFLKCGNTPPFQILFSFNFSFTCLASVIACLSMYESATHNAIV